jgi:hypothetical protein
MKKLVVTVTVVTLLAIGFAAYAHGPGGWGGSNMGPGYGYGPQMMGPGYSGHMRGSRGGFDRKFFDETADLRREMHNKRFEYSEAIRNPESDSETITKLENEIRDLQDQIHAKSPRRGYGRTGGYGCQW